MTSKGQVTFPKPIRDKLRLRPGDKIEFMLVEEPSAGVREGEPLASKTAVCS